MIPTEPSLKRRNQTIYTVKRMAGTNEKVVQDAPVVKPKLESETTASVSDTSFESYKTPLISEIDTDEDLSFEVKNEDLISRAEVLNQEDKLLEAARLLRKVNDDNLLSPIHKDIVKLAEKCEVSLADLIGPPGEGSGWTKQGESHGSRPTNIYNKLDNHNRLSSRIETPIEASLLIPLLSVFNETSMYQSWMPSSQIPPIGVRESNKLEQTGRANQLIQVVVDVPWPLYTREAIIRGMAVDDIDEHGCIFVRLSPEFDGPKIPPLKPFYERVDFDGGILFRSCPEDHELLKRMSHVTEEPLVLVSFKIKLKSNVAGVPVSLINFVTKHMIGGLWGMLLYVAEGVRDGKRPKHMEAIEAKPEFYRWVERRATFMLQKMKKDLDQANSNEADQEFISYLQS